MIEKCLTRFHSAEHQADFFETIGNASLGCLKVGFGKTFEVKKLTEKTVFIQKHHSTLMKVSAVSIFLIFSPILLPLALIGCIATHFSKSHQEIFNAYLASQEKTELSSPRGTKHVHFNETPRGRIFSNDAPPLDVGQTSSVELKKIFSTESQQRTIPPVNLGKTTLPANVEAQIACEREGMFEVEEIIQRWPRIGQEKIGAAVYAYHTQHGKAIIRQLVPQGSMAAAVAMLIKDHGKEVDVHILQQNNLKMTEAPFQGILEAGLTPLIHHASTLQELRNIIRENGSAIVFMKEALGSPAIIVDDIPVDLYCVRIRDPHGFYGGELTVTGEAFCKRWQGSDTIQIKNTKIFIA